MEDDKYVLKNNSCILKENENCESGMFYDTESSQCQSCDVTCQECSSFSSKNCLSCPKLRPYLSEGQCVTHCQTNYYLDTESNHCFKCNDNCESCSDQKSCTKCKPDYVSNGNNECVRTILNGIFIKI